ncbi:eCIS core domain-containing protein [Saccharospirillum salsuginis]|uniref:eCIS core domain-containing protein n=1 Tax=Saccharospirillum salsuginis TaxID=418750 RepID=A0A918NAU9_9GAMM|nr:DUF4157 domain-containing protein [Saccharospirillum salsuginis]GGX54628.1 hypothetical protein GCM10007392_22560 [Saccharospirillum salsuginis]
MKFGAAFETAVILSATPSWAEEYFEPMDKMHLTSAEREWIHKYAPLAFDWVEEAEANTLTVGRKLSDAEIELAKSLSVKNPERIRVLVTSDFPVPSNKDLYTAFQNHGFVFADSAGMTLGHAVFIKPEHEDDIQLLAHEFAHVAQAEAHGLRSFLVSYLAGLKMYGYMDSPLESEARAKAWRSANGTD